MRQYAFRKIFTSPTTGLQPEIARQGPLASRGNVCDGLPINVQELICPVCNRCYTARLPVLMHFFECAHRENDVTVNFASGKERPADLIMGARLEGSEVKIDGCPGRSDVDPKEISSLEDEVIGDLV